MRNIFLEKSCIKCSGETSPRSFSKSKQYKSGLKVLQFIFIICQVEGWHRPLNFTSYKAFKKQREVWN